MIPQSKSATLPDGVRLPYVEQGDPAGLPVVFLHGYSDSWRTWEPLLTQLPQFMHAFAITQRGHGDADRPRDGYRHEDMVADVAAFMDVVGLDAALIAGHSGGGYTAQRFAVDWPARTLGTVLIGTWHDIAANAVQDLAEAVAEFEDPIDPGFVREFQESCVAEPVSRAFIDAIVAPTLILWGDQDPFWPRAEQDALVAACPDARLSVYEGTGHSVQWEQPERVAADLAAFTTSIAGGAVSHA